MSDVTLRDLLREAWRIAPLWRIPGEVGWRTWRATNRRDNVEVLVNYMIGGGGYRVQVRQRGLGRRLVITIANPTVEAVAAAMRVCGWDLAAVDRGEATDA